jgi:hypothetical protein
MENRRAVWGKKVKKNDDYGDIYYFDYIMIRNIYYSNK